MDSIEELIKGKANQIDVDGHRQDNSLAQEELDRFSDKAVKTRVVSLEGNTLVVQVTSASHASNLRMQRVPILRAISSALERQVEHLRIRIGSK